MVFWNEASEASNSRQANAANNQKHHQISLNIVFFMILEGPGASRELLAAIVEVGTQNHFPRLVSGAILCDSRHAQI